MILQYLNDELLLFNQDEALAQQVKVGISLLKQRRKGIRFGHEGYNDTFVEHLCPSARGEALFK
jgi:hypothetical protein